jgi:hypothetical protein
MKEEYASASFADRPASEEITTTSLAARRSKEEDASASLADRPASEEIAKASLATR